MLTKKKLIEALDGCIRMEEKVVELYSRNISSIMPLSGMKDEEKNKIKEVLDVLRKDSEHHRMVFKEQRDLLAKEGANGD